MTAPSGPASGPDSGGRRDAVRRAAGPDATAWVLLAAAIAAEVTGSLSLKAALDAPWLYAMTAAGYLGAFVLLAAVLRRGMALGVAYGIWGACGVALTAVLSAAVFGEPLTWLMGAGIVLIVAGVLCLELGARGAEQTGERA